MQDTRLKGREGKVILYHINVQLGMQERPAPPSRKMCEEPPPGVFFIWARYPMIYLDARLAVCPAGMGSVLDRSLGRFSVR